MLTEFFYETALLFLINIYQTFQKTSVDKAELGVPEYKRNEFLYYAQIAVTLLLPESKKAT